MKKVIRDYSGTAKHLYWLITGKPHSKLAFLFDETAQKILDEQAKWVVNRINRAFNLDIVDKEFEAMREERAGLEELAKDNFEDR